MNTFSYRKIAAIGLLVWLFSCSPWSSETKEALEAAGDNRAELERVLTYYHEIAPDPLKLKAAEYLISNLIYQYSLFGPGVDSLNATYRYTYEVFREDRLHVFGSDSLKKRRTGDLSAEYDIRRITSEYLIGQIEAAFSTYQRYEWAKWYPFEIFCEYILPFKIGHSDTISWRTFAQQKYGHLMDYQVFETPAAYYEAETYRKPNQKIVPLAAASDHAVLLLDTGNVFEFPFHTKWDGYQLFHLHYLNGHPTAANLRIFIDEVEIGDFIFPSTGSWENVDRSMPPMDFTVMLDSGEHHLVLQVLDKEILLDFLYVPEYLHMALPQSAIQEGTYYLRCDAGNLTADSLENEAGLKVQPDVQKASRFQLLPKEQNLFQLVIQKDSVTKKALDAFPFGDSDWMIVYNDHGYMNQQWAFIPKGVGYQIRNRETGKILGYRERDSVLVQLPVELMRDEYIWYLDAVPDTVTKGRLDLAVKAAERISAITNRFHWSGSYVEIGPVSPVEILNYAYGSCVEEADFQTMLLRSMGVACAVDFVFNYPERNAGHNWSVIFDVNGKTIQNNCHNPVGAGTWVDAFAKGKVYRKSNTINRNSLFIQNGGKEQIPKAFQNPYFWDVTREYVPVQNIQIEVETDGFEEKYGYLMVFNNERWVPVGWGERVKNTIVFKDLEPRGMYLPARFENGAFLPFNRPFYFDSLGTVQHIKGPNGDSILLTLKRKFPNRLVDSTYHRLIVGGMFQGANRADFSDAVTLGVITSEMTEPLFYEINVAETKAFRYLRYLGPADGRCNINEMAFFDRQGMLIEGDIIGTDGSNEGNGRTRELVFDGDVLTYFDAPEPSGSWVGLKLKESESVEKIRFITRNDGNMVEIGDEYELMVWDNADWRSLGRTHATSDSLTFNAPQGALFWLQNHTKGWEERIFTLDDQGRQVWW